MPEALDSLQIEISANANSASKQIDKLVTSLNSLKNSVSGISGLSQIASDLKEIGSIKVTGLSGLAKQINQLGSMDTSKISQMKSALKEFGNSVNQLNGISVSPQISQMSELTRSISRLGNASAGMAIANMPKLADGLKQMMGTLSKAPKVSQNLIDMTKALADFSRTGSSGVKAANSLGTSIKNMTAKTLSAPKALKSLNASLKSTVSQIKQVKNGILSALGVVGGITAIISGIKKSIDVRSDVTEAQNVIDVTFGRYKDLVEDMAKTSIRDFGISELAAKNTAGRYQAMGTAAGIARKEMAKMSVTLTGLSADMASFYNQNQEDVVKSLQSVFTGETEPLRKYGIDLTQATLKEWAMKQGLDANIQSMSQAEKIMLRYNYVLDNSAAAQGDFARTSGTWANSIKILKEQLTQLASVLGTAFINALKPLVTALNKALASIIEFAVKVVNALGAIFGWKAVVSNAGIADDFSDAASGADSLADSTGKAAKNAKKLKDHLLSIDELNVVQPDADSSGSGGSGSGSGAGGGGITDDKAFEIVETENPYKSSIKNLYGLGKEISKTLMNEMNSIDWDSIYAKASGFGKGLAQFLNGLISPELFSTTATTIANSIKTALVALNSFGTTFDWTNFGNSIASGINSFFRDFDWKLLAQTINAWAKGLLDSLIAALENTDWEMVGNKIGEFLSEIDFKGIAERLAKAIWLAIEAAWKVIHGSFDVSPIETALGLLLTAPAILSFGSKIVGLIVAPISEIGVIISGMLPPIISSFSSIASAITALSVPVVALTAAFVALGVGLASAFAKNEQAREGFLSAALAISESLEPAIAFLKDTVLPGLNEAWKSLKSIMSPLVDFVKDTFLSAWNDMINPALKTLGKSIIPAVTKAFEALWNNVLVPLGSFIGSVLSPVIKTLSKILSTLWKNVVVPLAQAIGDVFTVAIQAMSDVIVSATNNVGLIITAMQSLWNDVLTPFATYMSETFAPIFDEAFSLIKELIGNMKTTLSGLIKFITGVFTGNWSKAWDGVKEVFRGVFNGIVAIAEKAVNGIISGINTFLGGFNKIVTSVGDIVGISVSIPEISKVQLPRYAAGGFPEDGLFFANHTELVGSFSNGKTAVANNEQIIAGIEEAAYRGFSRAYSENNREASLLEELIVAVREGKEITVDGRSLVSAYDARKTRNGFSFT